MASKEPSRPGGYAGKISNSGVQKVEAPFKTSSKGTSTVKTGTDLRDGGGKKGGK
jgi:hypothetical protein